MISPSSQVLIHGIHDGFPFGRTNIASPGDSHRDFGIEFGIIRQRGAESLRESSSKESVWVLLSGSARVEVNGQNVVVSRSSVFDEAPWALHVARETQVSMTAGEN